MKGKVINIPTGESGLPCKSYVHILDLDIKLRIFLSYIDQNDYFSQYIINGIVHFYRYKDRQEAVNNFLDFMVTYGADRINFMFPSRMFNRTACVQFLNSVQSGITKYKQILYSIKHNKQISKEDIVFYNIFSKRWLFSANNTKILINQINQIHYEVNNLIKRLIYYYQSYIIKYLLKNRRGDSNPRHLRTDAYNLVMTLLNVYNYKKSKIPFHNILRPYISNYKNKIIQYETWNNNTIIYIDEKDESEDDNSLSLKNSIMGEIEKQLYNERKQDDKYQLVEMAYLSLPKPLKEMISLLYEFVDPLTIEQEIKMGILSYKGGK